MEGGCRWWIISMLDLTWHFNYNGGVNDEGYVPVDNVDGLFRQRMMKNSNSYLRDILGDILGKDMYYPLTFVKPIRVSLVYKRNPKAQYPIPRNYKWYQSLWRDSEKEESLRTTDKHPTSDLYKMSQPANDEFSQHLLDNRIR
ncbi:hypothetical protein Tco_0489032 [Tanacetum coccineum]